MIKCEDCRHMYDCPNGFNEDNCNFEPYYKNDPELIGALKMLYDETMDYIKINNLGAHNNQSMVRARNILKKYIDNIE